VRFALLGCDCPLGMQEHCACGDFCDLSDSTRVQSLQELENEQREVSLVTTLIDRRLALSQSVFSTQPANITHDTRIAKTNQTDSNHALKDELAKKPTQEANSKICDEFLRFCERANEAHLGVHRSEASEAILKKSRKAEFAMGGGLNEKAFISAHNFKTLNDLIAHIKHIDNDNAAALKILREPLFLDSNHKEMFEARLEAFLVNIFSQDFNNAFRYNRSYLRAFEEARYRRYIKLLGVLKKINNIKMFRWFYKKILARLWRFD